MAQSPMSTACAICRGAGLILKAILMFMAVVCLD